MKFLTIYSILFKMYINKPKRVFLDRIPFIQGMEILQTAFRVLQPLSEILHILKQPVFLFTRRHPLLSPDWPPPPLPPF